MDPHRFDAFSRVVASLTTRRAALAIVAGLGFGARELAAADARKSGKCKPRCGECERCKKGDCNKKNGKKRCKKGRCRAKAAGSPCSAFPSGACQNRICVNLKADEANCGSLGNACGAAQVCQEGRCFPVSSVCPPTTRSACTPSAPTGTLCGALTTCICSQTAEGNVVCVQPPPTCPGGTACTSSASCPPGQACVDVGTCCAGAFPPGSKICMAPCPTPA